MKKRKSGQTDPKGWVTDVKIVSNDDGKTDIYIQGKKVNNVMSYKIEGDQQGNRIPVLTLQVQCRLDVSETMVPLLPEPWTWFYKPIVDNFIDVREPQPPKNKD